MLVPDTLTVKMTVKLDRATWKHFEINGLEGSLMIDWEASTGGYLLTACFATGRAAGRGAARWLAGGPGRNGGRDGAGPWHTPRPS